MPGLNASPRYVIAHNLLLGSRPDGAKLCRDRIGGAVWKIHELYYQVLRAFVSPEILDATTANLSRRCDATPDLVRRVLADCIDRGWIHESGDVICDPLFVISTPRAGSTLLFELLSKSPAFWTIGTENHFIFETFARLRTDRREYESDRLTEQDADDRMTDSLRAAFVSYLRNQQGCRFSSFPADQRPGRVRLLEKTPRNALRLPFLDAVFPDARFVFLYRDPAPCISSIMEAWNVPEFERFKGNLPGWDREKWCMLLPSGWRSLIGKPLEQVAAFQWTATNTTIMDDLANIRCDRVLTLRFEELIRATHASGERICRFANVPFDPALQRVCRQQLPLSSTVVTPPDPDKWKRHAAAIESVLPAARPVVERFEAFEQAARESRPIDSADD